MAFAGIGASGSSARALAIHQIPLARRWGEENPHGVHNAVVYNTPIRRHRAVVSI